MYGASSSAKILKWRENSGGGGGRQGGSVAAAAAASNGESDIEKAATT